MALNAVANWRGRGGLPSYVSVDAEGAMIQGSQVPGWIVDMLDVCQSQLAAVYPLNVGLVAEARSLADWMAIFRSSLGDSKNDRRLESWKSTIERFYDDFDRVSALVNEGGFFIRLLELLERHLQRRWYIDLYGRAVATETAEIPPAPKDNDSPYLRVVLPNTMPSLPVPTVQPFHAVIDAFRLQDSSTDLAQSVLVFRALAQSSATHLSPERLAHFPPCVNGALARSACSPPSTASVAWENQGWIRLK